MHVKPQQSALSHVLLVLTLPEQTAAMHVANSHLVTVRQAGLTAGLQAMMHASARNHVCCWPVGVKGTAAGSRGETTSACKRQRVEEDLVTGDFPHLQVGVAAQTD